MALRQTYDESSSNEQINTHRIDLPALTTERVHNEVVDNNCYGYSRGTATSITERLLAKLKVDHNHPNLHSNRLICGE